MIAAVINHEYFHVHSVMNNCLKLLKIHLNTAVAGHTDNILMGIILYYIITVGRIATIFIICHPRSYGRRQIIAH